MSVLARSLGQNSDCSAGFALYFLVCMLQNIFFDAISVQSGGYQGQSLFFPPNKQTAAAADGNVKCRLLCATDA